MVQKFIVRTVKRFSGLGRCYWLLYRYDSESSAYHFVGCYTTLGQLLCAMGGDVLENWHYIRQTASPSNSLTITRYYYPAPADSGKFGLEVDVVENRELRWYDNEAEDSINCKLSPTELYKISTLLHCKRLEPQNALNQYGSPITADRLLSLADELALVDKLGGKIHRLMEAIIEENSQADHNSTGGTTNEQ